MKNYKPVLGKTGAGLAAPVKDLKCSHTLMKEMKLKESNPFFHCKANYEATKRSGVYGAGVANIIDAGKEMKDIFINKYPIADSVRDYRANLRGQRGALQGKTLEKPVRHTIRNINKEKI